MQTLNSFDSIERWRNVTPSVTVSAIACSTYKSVQYGKLNNSGKQIISGWWLLTAFTAISSKCFSVSTKSFFAANCTKQTRSSEKFQIKWEIFQIILKESFGTYLNFVIPFLYKRSMFCHWYLLSKCLVTWVYMFARRNICQKCNTHKYLSNAFSRSHVHIILTTATVKCIKLYDWER